MKKPVVRRQVSNEEGRGRMKGCFPSSPARKFTYFQQKCVLCSRTQRKASGSSCGPSLPIKFGSRGWNQMIVKVPSNPYHSMILAQS